MAGIPCSPKAAFDEFPQADARSEIVLGRVMVPVGRAVLSRLEFRPAASAGPPLHAACIKSQGVVMIVALNIAPMQTGMTECPSSLDVAPRVGGLLSLRFLRPARNAR